MNSERIPQSTLAREKPKESFTYILIKGWGNLGLFTRKDGTCALNKHMCNIHSHVYFGGTQLTRENSVPDQEVILELWLCSESSHNLDGLIVSSMECGALLAVRRLEPYQLTLRPGFCRDN